MRELDVAEAAKVATSLPVVAASGRDVIIDLEGLELIDSMPGGAGTARRAGFDLLLAAPITPVRRPGQQP